MSKENNKYQSLIEKASNRLDKEEHSVKKSIGLFHEDCSFSCGESKNTTQNRSKHYTADALNSDLNKGKNSYHELA